MRLLGGFDGSHDRATLLIGAGGLGHRDAQRCASGGPARIIASDASPAKPSLVGEVGAARRGI